MANRDFNEWLSGMRDTIATWNYYTDFEKAYSNVNKIKVELNILNSLIGSKNIEDDFKNLLNDYPKILKIIPILIAKREKRIKIIDASGDFEYSFSNMNYSIDDYCKFMRNSGIFDLLENRVIGSLIDYVTGVEVGMDSNGRKNRTGDAMEDLVESFIVKAGFKKGIDYYKEIKKSIIEDLFNMDLGAISNSGKTEKRFDFAIIKNNCIYAIECNFYSSQGSKLNETARSYKNLALESKEIPGFKFIWFTDGIGWNTAKHNLEETFDTFEDIYNIKDLENGILNKIIL